MKKLIALVLVAITAIALAAPALACDGCYAPPPPPTCCYCHHAPCQCYQPPCNPPKAECKKTAINLVKGVNPRMKPCCDAKLYQVVHCKTDGLNIRKGPSTRDNIIVRIKDGAYVWVLDFVGKCGNWAYIQYANDRHGYVMTSYLKPVDESCY